MHVGSHLWRLQCKQACAPRLPSRVSRIGIAESDRAAAGAYRPVSCARTGVYSMYSNTVSMTRCIPESPKAEARLRTTDQRPAPITIAPAASTSAASLLLRLPMAGLLHTSCECCRQASLWRPRPQLTDTNKLCARASRFETRLAPANLRPLARTLMLTTTPNRPLLLSPACYPSVCSPRQPPLSCASCLSRAPSHDTAPGSISSPTNTHTSNYRRLRHMGVWKIKLSTTATDSAAVVPVLQIDHRSPTTDPHRRFTRRK